MELFKIENFIPLNSRNSISEDIKEKIINTCLKLEYGQSFSIHRTLMSFHMVRKIIKNNQQLLGMKFSMSPEGGSFSKDYLGTRIYLKKK